MSSRLLYGIAAATLAGLIWTSVDREAKPDVTGESQIERPLAAVESEPSRAATRARATRGGGGLPARDRSAPGRQSSAVQSAAPSNASRSVANAQPARSASSAPASARAAARVTQAPLNGASEPSGPGNAASADEERARSQGMGGSVQEKSGAPVAGLTVGLTARRIFNSAAAPSAARTATTDGRGNFAFGPVADGEYEIRTEKNDRYDSAFALVRAGTDSVVLVVEPVSGGSIAIRGRVESASGGVLEGVRVQVMGRPNLAATTDANGAYALRVPAGARAEQTALQFRRTGYRDRRWSMADGVRSHEYEVIADVRLEPDTAGVSVTGVVTSTDGAPVVRAQVQLNSSARGRSYRGVSDGNGRFTLTNVEAGADYRLWARAQSGYQDRVLENVMVDAGIGPIDVELSPIGVATLRGRMVGPDGAPVPGFTMYLTSANGGGPRAVTVTGDGQGRFAVRDLPEGRVSLQTRAAPAISVSGIELSANSSGAEVTVVVDVGAHRVEGRVLMGDGGPAPATKVLLEWSGSNGTVNSRSSRDTITDADGNFVFSGLGAGVHTVSATLAGTGSVRVEHAVGAGMAPIQIKFPARRGTR